MEPTRHPARHGRRPHRQHPSCHPRPQAPAPVRRRPPRGRRRETVAGVEAGRGPLPTRPAAPSRCVGAPSTLGFATRAQTRPPRQRRPWRSARVGRDMLADARGWEWSGEVSFRSTASAESSTSSRGTHATRSLLIIELKTELVDPQDLVAVMHRRVRLGDVSPRASAGSPARSAAWVIVRRSRTERRRLLRHERILRRAFPSDGRTMRDGCTTHQGWSRRSRCGLMSRRVALGPQLEPRNASEPRLAGQTNVTMPPRTSLSPPSHGPGRRMEPDCGPKATPDTMCHQAAVRQGAATSRQVRPGAATSRRCGWTAAVPRRADATARQDASGASGCQRRAGCQRRVRMPAARQDASGASGCQRRVRMPAARQDASAEPSCRRRSRS